MTAAASIPIAPYDRRVIQDAIHDWFSTTTGLGADRTWWAGQDAVETDFPFGTLSWLSTSPIGVDGDGTTALYSNEALPPGLADVRLHAEGWRIVTIAVAAFSDPRGQPELDAFMMVDAAIARLRLPTVRAILTEVGIGILSTTGTTLVGPGHATAQMTLLITSSVSEDVFSIQGVRVLSTDDSDVPLDTIAPAGFAVPSGWSVFASDAGTEEINFEAGGIPYRAILIRTTTTVALKEIVVETVGTGTAYAFAIGRGGAGGGNVGDLGGGGGGAGGMTSAFISTIENGQSVFMDVDNTDATIRCTAAGWLLAAGHGGLGALGGQNAGVVGNGKASSHSGPLTGAHSRGGSGGGGGGGEGTGGTGGAGDSVGHAGKTGGAGESGAGGGGGGIHAVGADGIGADGGAGGAGMPSSIITAALVELVGLATFSPGGGGGAGLGGIGGEGGAGADGAGGGPGEAGAAGGYFGGGGGGAGGGAPLNGGAAGPAIVAFVFPRP